MIIWLNVQQGTLNLNLYHHHVTVVIHKQTHYHFAMHPANSCVLKRKIASFFNPLRKKLFRTASCAAQNALVQRGRQNQHKTQAPSGSFKYVLNKGFFLWFFHDMLLVIITSTFHYCYCPSGNNMQRQLLHTLYSFLKGKRKRAGTIENITSSLLPPTL